MPTEDPPVLAHLAGNVRRLRKACDLSQEELATRAGISRRTIVALEAGEANLSLSGVDHLARALGTDFITLVKSSSAQPADISEVLWRGDHDDSIAILLGTAPATLQAELWSWSLAPGERYAAQPDPAGNFEMILVSAGQLRIEREDGTADLTAGQHAIYPSDQCYAYVNPTAKIARFIRIVAT